MKKVGQIKRTSDNKSAETNLAKILLHQFEIFVRMCRERAQQKMKQVAARQDDLKQLAARTNDESHELMEAAMAMMECAAAVRYTFAGPCGQSAGEEDENSPEDPDEDEHKQQVEDQIVTVCAWMRNLAEKRPTKPRAMTRRCGENGRDWPWKREEARPTAMPSASPIGGRARSAHHMDLLPSPMWS